MGIHITKFGVKQWCYLLRLINTGSISLDVRACNLKNTLAVCMETAHSDEPVV